MIKKKRKTLFQNKILFWNFLMLKKKHKEKQKQKLKPISMIVAKVE
jgi:hypothetical protein